MTKDQINKLIEDNTQLVHFLIKKYFNNLYWDEDIIQSGMLGLCRAANTWVQEKGAFSTYASMCILNQIRYELRKRNKHKDVISLETPVKSATDKELSLMDVVVGDKDVDYIDLSPILKRLSEKEIDVFKMRCDGMKEKEIAEKLGFSKPYVSNIIRKIKRLLIAHGYCEPFRGVS